MAKTFEELQQEYPAYGQVDASQFNTDVDWMSQQYPEMRQKYKEGGELDAWNDANWWKGFSDADYNNSGTPHKSPEPRFKSSAHRQAVLEAGYNPDGGPTPENDEEKAKQQAKAKQQRTGFDAGYYLRNNPDVRRAVDDGTYNSAWEHYKKYGRDELRPVNPDQANNPLFQSLQDIDNPQMPDGTQYDPVMQEVGEGETLDSNNYQVDPNSVGYNPAQGQAFQAQAPSGLTPAQAKAYTIDPNNVPEAEAILGEIREEAKVEAAQGNLSQETLDALQRAERINREAKLNKRATVQYQYEQLTDFPAGEIPAWAKGAVREAESRMAARGLGSSSIAAGEINGAILKAAMPIAQQDAQIWAAFENKKLDNQTQSVLTKAGFLADMDMANLNNRQQAAVQNARNFLEMDLTNLRNQQQTAIVNAQAKQQQLLSNQSAQNAAENLNVQSQNQMKMFESELSANISKFNASQRNAMERFNVGELNAASRFNSEMRNQREQFNVKNRRLIDQFNAQYRRQINTRNTDAQNRANYVNSQNLLNISNTAMNNALTFYRDHAGFVHESSENALDRASNEAIAMMNNEAAMGRLMEQMDAEGEAALWSTLGQAGVNIVSEAAEDIDFGNIFGSGEPDYLDDDYEFTDDFGTGLL